MKKFNILALLAIFCCFNCSSQENKKDPEIKKKCMQLQYQAVTELTTNDNADIALDLINQAIKLDSSYLLFYVTKAQIHCRQKKYLEAIKSFELVEQKNANYTEAIVNQAFIYEKINNPDMATKKYQMAENAYIQKDKIKPDINNDINRAFLSLFLYNKERAIAEIEEIVANNPDNKVAKYQLSLFRSFDREVFINDFCK